jgi:hypothetical protein
VKLGMLQKPPLPVAICLQAFSFFPAALFHFLFVRRNPGSPGIIWTARQGGFKSASLTRQMAAPTAC